MTGIARMIEMVGLGKSWFLINHNVCGTIPKAHMKQGFAGGLKNNTSKAEPLICI